MTWPIAHALCEHLRAHDDGTITTDRGRVIAPRGWIQVPAAPELPDLVVDVHLRLGEDAHARPCLYAHDVRIGERRYADLHRLALAEGAGWIAYLARAIPGAITRRANAADTATRVAASATTLADAPRVSPTPPPTAAAAPRAAARRAPRRVLVVEDDDAVRDALREALDAEGHSVVTVPHAGAAIAYLDTRPSVDVILLDLMMPEMDGWTFLARRQREPALAAIPVVVLTAHYGPARVVRKAGVSAVLPKPFDTDDVLGAIDRCIAS